MGKKVPVTVAHGDGIGPGGFEETFCSDHWRCRFTAEQGKPVTHEQIVRLLSRLGESKFDFIKTEHLYAFNGEKGYSE